MEKTTVLVFRYPCEDPYYSGHTFSWREFSYLDSQEKKDEQKKKFYKTHEYWGETLLFLDAIKIDGKIFIDTEELLGNENKKLGISK